MSLWKSLSGTVTAELISADITRALAAITGLGISVCRVIYRDTLTVELTLDRRDLPRVKCLAEKRGDVLRCVGKKGLYWTVVRAGTRPVLLLGMISVLLMTLLLPTRVLFVRVEGNETVPTRFILAEAEDCGIRFGASRREVRSEKVKNALLSAIPRLQWAGVNTSGCVATICVREKSDTQTEQDSGEVSSIVADRDGVVLSFTVTAGSIQCAPGQAVREGQVLISGYTDCGLLIRATRAEGEIMAQTRRSLSVISLSQCRVRGSAREETRQYSLILGKKRINFANSSRICDTTCGRMYEEYYITLPGGFVLPIALAVQTHICYETQWDSFVPENMQDTLRSFSRSYLIGQMVSGSIQGEACIYESEDGSCLLTADFVCREMIGRRVQEGKGNGNGKSD